MKYKISTLNHIPNQYADYRRKQTYLFILLLAGIVIGSVAGYFSGVQAGVTTVENSELWLPTQDYNYTLALIDEINMSTILTPEEKQHEINLIIDQGLAYELELTGDEVNE